MKQSTNSTQNTTAFRAKFTTFHKKSPCFYGISSRLSGQQSIITLLYGTSTLFFRQNKSNAPQIDKSLFFQATTNRKTRTGIRINRSKTNNYEQKRTNKPRNLLTIPPIQSNLHLFASTSPLHHPTTKKHSPPLLLRPSSLYPIVEFVHVQLCILCRNNYFCIQTHRCHGNTFSPRSPACSLITSALSR